MSRIVLVNASCADQTVDAVVNAANDGLRAGGGICGVIFRKAGVAALTAACRKFRTPLKDGSAVITPAFQMKNARYIIHAVGPDFGKTPKAFRELFDAYYNSLYVLMDNGLHSISFPLISSGIFGGSLANPVAESTKQCCRAYLKFISDYPAYDVDVKVCAFSSQAMQEAKRVFGSMIEENSESTNRDVPSMSVEDYLFFKSAYENDPVARAAMDAEGITFPDEAMEREIREWNRKHRESEKIHGV